MRIFLFSILMLLEIQNCNRKCIKLDVQSNVCTIEECSVDDSKKDLDEYKNNFQIEDEDEMIYYTPINENDMVCGDWLYEQNQDYYCKISSLSDNSKIRDCDIMMIFRPIYQ